MRLLFMNYKKIIFSLFLGTVFCLCGSLVRAERIYLDITASDVRKIVVAIPDFTYLGVSAESGKIGRDISTLLARGLEFHGFIEVLANEKYGGRKDVDWKSLGADYVILGKYDSSASAMMIEGSILDVEENKVLTGRRYKGSISQQDDMVLRLCDAIIEEFTGEPGIIRTNIAFVSDESGRKEAYVADVLGRKVRQITRHHHLVVSPRFTPDGLYLCYSSYHSGNQNLYITDLRQNKITRAISRRRGMNMAPAWAPDGKRMVVTLSQDGGPDLYLLNRQGNILRRLTAMSGINVSATWSPDGKYIAFVSDRSGTPQVYLMDMATYRVQRLTFSGNENTEPAWSPKGNLIAYSSLNSGQYNIFTIDPTDTNSVKQITSGPGNFESPSWSPDGKQLVLSRSINNKKEIYAIFVNGKGLRRLFNLKGNQSYPQWSSRFKD